ncbi:PH domain-containing protein [Candidatus Micrarchaeota archaeon]|nr:PH domain-containing protein [Candidatus Micrarchaeota archaeon]
MKHISKKVFIEWAGIPLAVITIIFIALAFGMYYIGELSFGGITHNGIITMLGIIYVIISLGLLIMATIRYYSYMYQITDISLVLSKGIIHKHEITVPYINIQDVEREQNILDIIAGVCTIKVETAGSVSANIEIPGIDMNDNVDMIILEKKQEILEKQKKKSVEEEHKKEDEMLSSVEKAIILLSDQIASLRMDVNRLIDKTEKEMLQSSEVIKPKTIKKHKKTKQKSKRSKRGKKGK